MKRLLSFLVVSVVVPLALVPIAFLIERAIDAAGWGSPAWFASSLGWVRAMLETTVAIAGIAAFCGFAAGLWADGASRRFDGRHPMTRADRMKALAPDIAEFANEVDHAFRYGYIKNRQAGFFGTLGVILSKMKRDGLILPTGEKLEPDAYLRYVAMVFHHIHPMLRAGMVDQAKAALAATASWAKLKD